MAKKASLDATTTLSQSFRHISSLVSPPPSEACILTGSRARCLLSPRPNSRACSLAPRKLPKFSRPAALSTHTALLPERNAMSATAARDKTCPTWRNTIVLPRARSTAAFRATAARDPVSEVLCSASGAGE
eukprot:2324070-Rhodomonas_salina.4